MGWTALKQSLSDHQQLRLDAEVAAAGRDTGVKPVDGGFVWWARRGHQVLRGFETDEQLAGQLRREAQRRLYQDPA